MHFAGVDVDDHARGGLGVEAIQAVDQFVAQRMRGLEIEREAHRLQAVGIDGEARDMRIGQALLSRYFSMPAMPTLSLSTNPITWAPIGPLG